MGEGRPIKRKRGKESGGKVEGEREKERYKGRERRGRERRGREIEVEVDRERERMREKDGGERWLINFQIKYPLPSVTPSFVIKYFI